jgi:hypothetical protein
MRQKMTRPQRRLPRRRPVRRSVSTADWLVESEIGWGVPHVWVALAAMVVVGGRVLLAIGERLLARVSADRSTDDAEPRGTDPGS